MQMEPILNFKTLYDQRREQLISKDRPLISYLSQNIPIELLSIVADTIAWPNYVSLASNGNGSSKDNLVIPNDFCDVCLQSSTFFKKSTLNFPKSLIAATTCGQLIRTMENIPFDLSVYMLDIPKKTNAKNDHDYWYGELSELRRHLEDITGVEITEDGLRESVIREKEITDRLVRIMGVRRKEFPPLNAVEARIIYALRHYVHPSRYLETLNTVENNIESRISLSQSPYTQAHPRLLLVGPLTSEYLAVDRDKDTFCRFIEMVESIGAAIVVEENFPIELKYNDSHNYLKTIAEMHIAPTGSAYQDRTDKLTNHLIRLSNDFNIDGVLFVNSKFCDSYGYLVGRVERAFRGVNMPVLRLEFSKDEYREEQMMLRLEPYIKMLRRRRN